MQKLNRRTVMAALAGMVTAVPGAALAAKPAKPDLESGVRMLIAELRSKNPPEDLWKWKAGRYEERFFTFGQAESNKLIAARLERLLKAEG